MRLMLATNIYRQIILKNHILNFNQLRSISLSIQKHSNEKFQHEDGKYLEISTNNSTLMKDFQNCIALEKSTKFDFTNFCRDRTLVAMRSLSTQIIQYRTFYTSSYKKIGVFRGDSPIKPTEGAQSYDYVIIGAGSAGCVLAHRLSENKDNTVNIIEAGPKDDKWMIEMPAALKYNLRVDKCNWFYKTMPQKYLNNRELYWPRGRVLGGSSSLNAMVYVRGHPLDYDRWEKEGAIGWSYASCLPYFKRAQCHEFGENLYRGGSGPLNVGKSKSCNQLHHNWVEAGKQAGYHHTEDINGYRQEGFSIYDLTVHKGRRWSTSKAYLKPAMKNKNLSVTTDCLVTKILFDHKKAVGIEMLNKDGKLEKIMANKEVILSGGSINSPQLLMLSGVGDADELKKHSIPIVQHVPAVGKNLQDHLKTFVQHKCKKPVTLYKIQPNFPLNVFLYRLRWFLFKSGLGVTSHLDSGAFVNSEPSVPHPDLEFQFFPGLITDHGLTDQKMHLFECFALQLRSQDMGTITLSSNDPRKHPIIDPNYCSLERDFFELRQSVKLLREIFAQRAFDEFRGEETFPGKDVQSDKQIDEFTKAKAETTYHPTSTCKMGSPNDNNVVTDPQCRVVGVENLRVVDASIMPSMVSGNTNAPTIMIAEKASDMILNKIPLPRIENVPIWSRDQC